MDFYFNRCLEEEEIKRIENQVNSVIQADLPIIEETIIRDEAEKYYSLERLPEDVGDLIRIIKIGDYDACPCIGPHVCSTKEIDKFKIISTDFRDGFIRIRYKVNNSKNHR